MHIRTVQSIRGITLTELLVVMLIIGLLATIAVPVYINRMEDARVRMAHAECREIAQAEEQCGLIHGFYVPFQVLDDSPFISGQTTARDDSINQEPSGLYGVSTNIVPNVQRNFQARYEIRSTSQNSQIRDMVNSWEGPFLNPQRVYTGGLERPGDINYPSSAYFRLDFPIDPWGTPYRFYSPIGIVGSGALSVTEPYQLTLSNGLLTTNDNRNFERYAVVSWGRDTLPQTDVAGPTTDDDDIFYLFGSAGVESTFGQL